MEKLNIAIDGPAGAGKSTVARKVAVELGLTYIDTGAMYRALTWKALEQGIDLNDEVSVGKLAYSTKIRLIRSLEGSLRVECDGLDITDKIREPAVSGVVSTVAAYPAVRKRMVEMQLAMAARGGVIMDGRDIGTQVLPHAKFKFFLTASLAERARRRWLELVSLGFNPDLQELVAQISARDKQDENRETAPLTVAPDAAVIDTGGLSVDEVVNKIVGLVTGNSE